MEKIHKCQYLCNVVGRNADWTHICLQEDVREIEIRNSNQCSFSVALRTDSFHLHISQHNFFWDCILIHGKNSWWWETWRDFPSQYAHLRCRVPTTAIPSKKLDSLRVNMPEFHTFLRFPSGYDIIGGWECCRHRDSEWIVISWCGKPGAVFGWNLTVQKLFRD